MYIYETEPHPINNKLERKLILIVLIPQLSALYVKNKRALQN